MSLTPVQPTALIGPSGQRLLYLRLSLTEACDFACAYCQPADHGSPACAPTRLTPAAIGNILVGFRRMAFEKVRLTGGEPTLHPFCLDAVRLARAAGYASICLTTNAFGIGDLARWRDAGLTQLNVSLNSLRPDTFRRMTRRDGVERVLAVIDDACRLGIRLKVNTVLLRSINGAEIDELIDWALDRPLTLRFIETMPTRANDAFDLAERVLAPEIEPALIRRGLSPVDVSDSNDPSRRGPEVVWSRPNTAGRIGMINPLTRKFCGDCNRLRVTSDGDLKLCLYGQGTHPLDMSSPEIIESQVRRLAASKPKEHDLENRDHRHVATFRKIGG